jgi:hypothetical protein
VIGSDVANHGGGGKDFVPTARAYTDVDGRRKVEDIIYVIPGPQNGSCVGIGRTPPSGLYRTETGGRNGVGGLGIVMQPGNGNAVGIHDSNGTLRFRIGPDFSLEWRDRDGNVTARISGEDPPGQEQAPAPDHSQEIAELQRQVAELQAQLSDHKRRMRRRFRRLLRRDRS